MFGEQRKQEDRPYALPYVPLGQSIQPCAGVASTIDEYLPGIHCTHVSMSMKSEPDGHAC